MAGVQRASFQPHGASIIVPPGISVRPEVRGWHLVGRDYIGALEGDQEVRATFRLEYSQAKGWFDLASFGIDRGDLQIEVSGAFMRTVQIHAIVREGYLAAIPAWAMDLAQFRAMRVRGGLRSFAEYKPTDDESLLLTGLLYRIGELSGDNPVQLVADTIGLKLRTATNWVQRARAAGYMSSVEHAKAARRLVKDLEPLWEAFVREDTAEELVRRGITPEQVRAAVARKAAEIEAAR